MVYDSEIWTQDVDLIIDTLPELANLKGKSVLITGAAGLICSSVVDILMRYNDTRNGRIRILAAGRWLKEMTDRFAERVNRDDFEFVVYDASCNDNVLEQQADYIVHGASNAYPELIVKEPVETMLSNFIGLYHLLCYAKERSTKRLLYISSSEVYGRKEGDQPYREGEYGYIDLLNFRNSYSVGKRAAETLCARECRVY